MKIVKNKSNYLFITLLLNLMKFQSMLILPSW